MVVEDGLDDEDDDGVVEEAHDDEDPEHYEQSPHEFLKDAVVPPDRVKDEEAEDYDLTDLHVDADLQVVELDIDLQVLLLVDDAIHEILILCHYNFNKIMHWDH